MRERGKRIYTGIKGSWNDFIWKQIVSLVFLIFIAFTFNFLYIQFIQSVSQILAVLAAITTILLNIAIGTAIVLFIGFEIDAIYENGVTNRFTSLIDRIKGRTFQPSSSIYAIKYGKVKAPVAKYDLKFIAIIDGRNKKQLLRPFIGFGYRNKFFEELGKYFKEKCPTAKWILSNFDELERK